MSRVGAERQSLPQDCGFTLVEVLVVMLLTVMCATAASALYGAPSNRLQAKTAALVTASRLRDVRAQAISSGRTHVALINTATRIVTSDDGAPPLSLGNLVSLTVTAPKAEQRSPQAIGVRFFPNGSSSGATITIRADREAYDIRVNWLTGRISTHAKE